MRRDRYPAGAVPGFRRVMCRENSLRIAGFGNGVCIVGEAVDVSVGFLTTEHTTVRKERE